MSKSLDEPIDAALRAHADLGLDPNEKPVIVDPVGGRVTGARAGIFKRRRWPALVSGLAALSVAGVAAAATGLWSPPLGDDQRGHPSASTSEVPASQLQHLAILRRPADGADRDAITQSALRYLNDRFQGVRTASIRAAHGSASGQRILIIPVERSGSGIRDALCLYSVEREGGGIGCWTTQQILHGEAVLIALPASTSSEPQRLDDPQSLRPDAAGARVIGLVPDGVATVTTTAGARASVEDNVFNLTVNGLRADQIADQITWLNASGQVVPRR